MATSSLSLLSSLSTASWCHLSCLSHSSLCLLSSFSSLSAACLACSASLLSLPLFHLHSPPLLFILTPQLLKHLHKVHPPPFWGGCCGGSGGCGRQTALGSLLSCLNLTSQCSHRGGCEHHCALGTRGSEDRWRHRQPVPYCLVH